MEKIIASVCIGIAVSITTYGVPPKTSTLIPITTEYVKKHPIILGLVGATTATSIYLLHKNRRLETQKQEEQPLRPSAGTRLNMACDRIKEHSDSLTRQGNQILHLGQRLVALEEEVKKLKDN